MNNTKKCSFCKKEYDGPSIKSNICDSPYEYCSDICLIKVYLGVLMIDNPDFKLDGI
jgi:hypothetical protein